MKLVFSPPGEISKHGCWCLFDDLGYMYTHRSLFRLLVLVVREWRDDRHLVG